MALLDPLLQEILVCPQCHGALREDEPALRLHCEQCGLAFPVRDGIPVMLVDEADASVPADGNRRDNAAEAQAEPEASPS